MIRFQNLNSAQVNTNQIYVSIQIYWLIGTTILFSLQTAP